MTLSTADSFRLISEIKSHFATYENEQLLKTEALVLRQRMESLCRSVLLNNLESALDQKIETDLWNFAFKAQITVIQNALRSSQSNNAKKAELQSELSMFLESASGFYMQLLEDVCEAFNLHPNFRRKYSCFGIIQSRSEWTKKARSRYPNKSSSMYICQHCLVHLGDIARYLQRISLAENYYNTAATYVPYNGQPYNQLAILCSTGTNKLSVAYYYIRSIAVRSPFPVAPTNLEKLYSKFIKDFENSNFSTKNKWSHSDIHAAFVYFQALVHLEADKVKAQKLGELLYKVLSAQTIFSLLTVQDIHHIVTICLYALNNFDDLGGDKCLTEDERFYRDVVLAFFIGFLEILLNQATKYNIREHAIPKYNVRELISLPYIKVILDWLCRKEHILSHEKVKTHRCWLNLSKALNAMQSHSTDGQDISVKDSYPLPEDVELQCFLPLADAHENLEFSSSLSYNLDAGTLTSVRCQRLIELGRTIAEKYPSLNLIDYKVNAKNTKLIFSAPTAITVESSTVKKSHDKNIAIQALRAKEAVTDTQEDSWPLKPLIATSDSNIAPTIESSSSYSSFQSDVNPSRSSTSGIWAADLSASSRGKGVIGSEISNKPKVLTDLLASTSVADPSFSPINFSASDSSVFASTVNSYSLFDPSTVPFDLAIHPSTFQAKDLRSSSVDLFASSVFSNDRQSQDIWGTNSALSKLLDEQRRRSKPDTNQS